MRVKVSKFILPLLLVIFLGGVPLALATSQEGGVSHAEEQTTASVDAGHAAAAVETHDSTAVQEGHGSVEAGHGAEGAHGGKSITAAKLKDLFWRTVNFIALLIILIKFLAKPIGNALAGRQQQVIDELETLKAKRDAAERSYKEFEARLAGMEKEMEVVVQRAIAQAENEKAKILEDAEKAAEDIKRQSEAAIQAAIVEAKRALRDDIADQAAAMAEELIVKNLTPEDQVKITEQYLDRIGAVQ
ncbi:MAG: F0F1 ATP synthase subunit B family protein [Desulfobulbales bacterium]